jgi:prepilin-type N-terminal cleavage/methylation domain-containing protein
MKANIHNRMRGFTLIELLVVMSIIVILASLTTVAVSSIRIRVKQAVAKARFSEYMAAIQLCESDNGYFPDFGIQPNGPNGELIFPDVSGADSDWTDFWKTLYALKSPDESGPGTSESLERDEARELGNPKRRKYLSPSGNNHHLDQAGDLDWTTVKGMYDAKKKGREQVFLIIDLDGDGRFENPDPRTRKKHEFINKSVGFYSQEVKGGSLGKILFSTWD